MIFETLCNVSSNTKQMRGNQIKKLTERASAVAMGIQEKKIN